VKLRRKLALLIGIFQLSLVFLTSGCKTPPAPPEVEQALLQEQALWGAGGSIFARGNFKDMRMIWLKPEKFSNRKS